MQIFLPKVKNFFKSEKTICLILLTLVFLILGLVNFPYSKWFLGWDNLLPELNFKLSFQNGFFGLWQENEGLGILGGHGFAATLPHTLFLWGLSFLVPVQYLRPVFTLFSLYLGILGCFFLGVKILGEKSYKASLVASLFYLLNFGTVQMFYIPLEAFAVHFAVLPWLFWSLARLFGNYSKKNLWIFFLLSFLSSPQGFVEPLFAVYFLFLSLACLSFVLSERKAECLKKVFSAVFLTVLANAFWLLPFFYYSLTSGQVYLNSYNNLSSTENFVRQSEKFGTLGNLVMLKGFVYDAVDTITGRGTFFIFQPWREFLGQNIVKLLYGSLFGIALLGLLSTFKKGSYWQKIVAIFFAVSFVFLASGVEPFSVISNILRSNLPLFKQAFRIAFTKFSIIYSLSYGLLLGLGINFLLSLSNKFFKNKGKMIKKVIFVLASSLVIFISLPAFKGNFFYERIKVNLPGEYLDAFRFFEKEGGSSRIANFPQATSTGWSFYKWGYTGSGFLWYGLREPILDRNFDVWSNFNENYYWEISYALYSKNLALFERVLEKYQIGWLLIDENVIASGSSKALFLEELEVMLTADGTQLIANSNQQKAISNKLKIELVKTFGKIKIYKVNLETPVRDFVWMENNLPVVNSYEWGNLDKGFGEVGNYITAYSLQLIANSNQQSAISHQPSAISNKQLDAYYPFRSLFTGRKTEDLDFEIEDLGDRFVFKKNLPKEVTNYELEIPPYDGKDLVEVDPNDLSITKYFIPTVDIDNLEIRVTVPKINGLYSAKINPVEQILEAKNCNQFSKGEVRNENGKWKMSWEVEVGSEETVLRLEAKDANNCSASFWLPDLPHKFGYLISAENKNISGKTLLFWLENLTNRKADQEIYLSQFAIRNFQFVNYLIQPPMAEDGLGYSLHFDNISIGREQTVNELGIITVNPIPYDFLMGIKLAQSSKLKAQNQNLKLKANNISINHPNPSLYEIKINGEVGENETLVLSQAYHEGWRAYENSSKCKVQSAKLPEFLIPFCGEEIKEHVLVNNWENGWQLAANNYQQSTANNQQLGVGSWGLEAEKRVIYLVFWPQYLEYAGFALMGTTIVILLYCYFAKKPKTI